MTEFYENKELLITQFIHGQSYTLFSKHLLKIPHAAYPFVPSLARPGHNHLWCEL